MTEFSFEPIGYINTCFKERFGTPRQPGLVPSSWGILRLRPELNLSEALQGLEGFSHLWLIFVFHQNTNKGIKAKVHPPRLGGEKTGLFSTRTPHRPNPIGLSVVKLERIDGGTVYLSGVDLVDGTPILDIKPYLPSADCLPIATGGWTQTAPERTIRVEFTDDALKDISRFLGERADQARSSIAEILELDPRPVFYKGTVERPNPYTDVYGFRFDDYNVVYRMTGDLASVQSLQPWAEYQAGL
jgi:tRNA-Thr(GGU) m(6)t(6)A37 methyltransferase TsaA